MSAKSDCLFCGDEPCAVHADKPKKKSKSSRTKFQGTDTTPQPILNTNQPTTNTEDWFKAAPKKFEVKAAEVEERGLTQDELIFREAVRNLEPILAKTELNRYRDILSPPKDARLSKLRADVKGYLDGSDG